MAETPNARLNCRLTDDGTIAVEFIENDAAVKTLTLTQADAGMLGAALLEAASRGHLKTGEAVPDMSKPDMPRRLVPSTGFGLLPIRGQGHTAMMFGCGPVAVGFPVPDEQLRHLGRALIEGAGGNGAPKAN